jgi:hypothetical protein
VHDPQESGARQVPPSTTGNPGDVPVVAQLTGAFVRERRTGDDRRRHWSLWSILYGGVRPRRRRERRRDDHEQHWLDWHEPSVLYLAIAIVLLSCTDALLTLNLLAVGGEELNVIMDHFIGRDASLFLAVKIGLTVVSVVLLGVAARRRFFGVVRVGLILEAVCLGYAVLIGYELVLLWRYLGDSGATGALLGLFSLG